MFFMSGGVVLNTVHRCFGELGLHESKYRTVRDGVLDVQRESSRFERTGHLLSELEREHELRRIEARLREIPSIGEELVRYLLVCV